MTGLPGRPPVGIEAARWLLETQRAELAEDPNRPRAAITSTRQAAEKFGISKSSVARQLVAIKNGKQDARSSAKPGRPSKITPAEEQMLSFHMFMLRRQMKPVTMNVVKDATNALLSRRDAPGKPVSRSWVRRWLRANRAAARAEAARTGGPLPGLDLAGGVYDEANEDDTALGDDAATDIEAQAPTDAETEAPTDAEPVAHPKPPPDQEQLFTNQSFAPASSTPNPTEQTETDAIANVQALVDATAAEPSNEVVQSPDTRT
ncbi:hypothetical protein F5Y17DRAFT_258321 [Xylariaceae sp. FL0594]|nr:hypothetical protein F5Y17DRAFT_258321 [Xylariaceae sp. FL0594]